MSNFTHTTTSPRRFSPFQEKTSKAQYIWASFELRKAYSKEKISHEDFLRALQDVQRITYEQYGIHLSAQLSPTEIVLHQNIEQQIKLEFINYPEFPQPKEKLEEAIGFLCELLASHLQQNRIVINFPDRHFMLYQKDQLDPGALRPKPSAQHLQTIDLIKQYRDPKLLCSWLEPDDPRAEALTNQIKIVSEEELLKTKGIPLFLRAIQAGKAHPVIPKIQLEYQQPTRIAIFTKFLLSGTPISLEIWEVEGRVDLNAEKPGKLIKKHRYE